MNPSRRSSPNDESSVSNCASMVAYIVQLCVAKAGSLPHPHTYDPIALSPPSSPPSPSQHQFTSSPTNQTPLSPHPIID